MKVSIKVLTYNREKELIRTLDTLIRSLPNLNERFEIDISVMNNGSALSIDRARKLFPSIDFHTNSRNLGLAGNFFNAIQTAKGDWVWILADDDTPLPLVLNSILLELDEGADHIILKRKNAHEVEVDEDPLQRNIGLSNNIFNVRSSKTALKRIRSLEIWNDTYPQVLLSQALGRIRLVDVCSYVDSQPVKHYSIDGFLKVTHRDIFNLVDTATYLELDSDRFRQILKLALSHIFHYGGKFVSSRTSRESKMTYVRQLRQNQGNKSTILLASKWLTQGVVLLSISLPRIISVIAVFFWFTLSKPTIAKQIKEGYAPSNQVQYFDYDSEQPV